MALPPGYENANLTSIAFAGSQAIVAAGGGLLVNDGGAWHVDASAPGAARSSPRRESLSLCGRRASRRRRGRCRTRHRDRARRAHFAVAVLAPAAAGLDRDRRRGGAGRGRVRAIVSVVPRLGLSARRRPSRTRPERATTDPASVQPAPGDGYLLRETATGWEDEERTAFAATRARTARSRATRSSALLLDQSGNGWAVGGWSGDTDSAGRGPRPETAAVGAIRERVRTARSSVTARDTGGGSPRAQRLAARSRCRPVRYDSRSRATPSATPSAPTWRRRRLDRTARWPTALAVVDRNAGGGDGPRALLYTGNRVRSGLEPADAARYAELLGGQPGLPVYPALGSDDVSGGEGVSSFESAFASFPAPLGTGAAPNGISTAGIPGAAAAGGARTHYAFDSHGPEGTVRVVVIDNSLGSLAASDPYQNPPEAQLPWLESVLADARAKGIPVIVMGSRSLNTEFQPEAQRRRRWRPGRAGRWSRAAPRPTSSTGPKRIGRLRIPSGAAETIPSFGTGTLGYRSDISGVVGSERADSLFGDSGVMVLEIGKPAAGSNVAGVRVRLIPGDRRPLAGGDRRHPAAPLAAGALPRPRSAPAGRRSLGPASAGSGNAGTRPAATPTPCSRRTSA